MKSLLFIIILLADLCSFLLYFQVSVSRHHGSRRRKKCYYDSGHVIGEDNIRLYITKLWYYHYGRCSWRMLIITKFYAIITIIPLIYNGVGPYGWGWIDIYESLVFFGRNNADAESICVERYSGKPPHLISPFVLLGSIRVRSQLTNGKVSYCRFPWIRP